jgi:serine/threonine protein kinase
VLHQIGVGALGPVFRTYEPTRDRLVAVKVFRLDITPEQSQSLADELAVATEAGLFHPSVVEPIASGIEGTVAYRAEEYVAAESLDVAMRHYAPAPIEKVLPFINQLAAAIDFARAAGVGHGALHPRDVFLTPDEARATGFGVVEALERVGLRAPVRRPYTAPERVAGQAWSTAADIFSLAAIAYEMLTGRRPAGTGRQIGPLTGDNAEALHEVLARAMADDPARRYPSATQFASALGAVRHEAPSRPTAFAGMASTPEPPVQPAIQSAAEAEPLDISLAEFQEEGADADVEPEELSVGQGEEDVEEDDLDEDDEDDVDERVLDNNQNADEDELDDLPIVPPPPSAKFSDDFVAPIPAAAGRQDRLFGVDDRVADPPRGLFVPRDVDVENDDQAAEHDDHVTLPGDGHEVAEEPHHTGFGLVPVAIILILGMAVAFAAGYVVRGRTESAPRATVAGVSQDEPKADKATEFSDQQVNPPAARPSAPASATPPRPLPEVPPPATAPAPVSGRLTVRSTPSGAAVTINGRVRGRTPLTMEKLPFRSYSVSVAQPGFLPARDSVSLTAAAPSRTVTMQLERRAAPARTPAAPARATREAAAGPGSLFIDSLPKGARVFVDGKPFGVTPVRVPDLPSGAHVVRLELPDHRPWTTTARVRAGAQERVSGSLEVIR